MISLLLFSIMLSTFFILYFQIQLERIGIEEEREVRRWLEKEAIENSQEYVIESSMMKYEDSIEITEIIINERNVVCLSWRGASGREKRMCRTRIEEY